MMAESEPTRGMEDLDRLLRDTSRTFALAIPLLPGELRRSVTVAYLLFRIADTFEDSDRWSPDERIRALGDFTELLHTIDIERANRLGRDWATRSPVRHEGYLELLERMGLVLEMLAGLPEPVRERIVHHTCRTADRMAFFVRQTGADGQLRLGSVAELRDYCYAVAGIVGEMLTDLYLLECPGLETRAGDLRRWAPLFGEALQLVNILRDASADGLEGRSYVPARANRAELFALAHADLGVAREYTDALRAGAAPSGVIAFNALPIELAEATLEVVEREGPGAKISRESVGEILMRVLGEGAADRG